MEWYDKPLRKGNYIRYAKMGLCEIPIDVGGRITFQNGMQVSTETQKMKLLWGRKELICNTCGIAAGFAVLEARRDVPAAVHLNFYSYDVNGSEVMLTWDHIVPRAEGGGNEQSNAQCLCEICNNLKGASENYKPTDIQKLRKEKGLPISYKYLADGSRIFRWTKKQWSTTLNGKSLSSDTGSTYTGNHKTAEERLNKKTSEATKKDKKVWQIPEEYKSTFDSIFRRLKANR